MRGLPWRRFAHLAGNDSGHPGRDRAPTPHFQGDAGCDRSAAQPVIASVHGTATRGTGTRARHALCVCAESAPVADTHGRWSMTPTWGIEPAVAAKDRLLKAKEMMLTGEWSPAWKRLQLDCERLRVSMINWKQPRKNWQDSRRIRGTRCGPTATRERRSGYTPPRAGV